MNLFMWITVETHPLVTDLGEKSPSFFCPPGKCHRSGKTPRGGKKNQSWLPN